MVRSEGEASGIKTDRIPPVVVAGPDVVQPAPGRVVASRYEIRARLGAGGMGSVWRAYDRELEEEVALKVLLPERLHDPTMLEHLRREVKLARRITHANVCRVFDYGEDGDLRFLTMELIEGRTLRALLTAAALTPEQALDRLAQVAEGLAAVHARGIIHRDLKPENVIVRPNGQAVVADFGLARAPLADQGGAADLAGTPAYMSPEQLRGEPLDARSDIFSLGLLAFEMLTGRSPFAGGSSVTKSRAILRAPPEALEVPTLPPQFVRSLDRVLARAMAKAPADRFASVPDFIVALAAARGAPSAEPERPAGPLRRARRWLRQRPAGRRPALALLFALPALAVAAAVSRPSAPEDTRPAVLVAPLDNLTGDPTWDGLAQGAVEAVRTGLRATPRVRLLDAPRAGGRPPAGATWVAAGSVQRVGSSLRLGLQLRAANGAAAGETVEVDGDPANPSALPEALRRRVLDEVRLLVHDYERRAQAEVATRSEAARARLREYFDLVDPAPRPEHFERGERLLDEALAADPAYAPALVERAWLRMKVGRSQARPGARAEALADIERALALGPRAPRALALRCHAMQVESNVSEYPTDAGIAAAMDACNEALRADPESAPARLALARLHESACQTEIAMTSLQRALELEVDRSMLGWLLVQLVHVSLQESKLPVADRVSRQLVEFYEEEKRLGVRAYSRRAGVPPIEGAHLMRAAVLVRLGQPESLDRAQAELLRELDTISGGIGDRWNEAAALRGLLRIARLRDREAPSTWRERLAVLERDYQALAKGQPGEVHAIATSYRWLDPDAALELIAPLGAPASFQEAFERALIYHAAGHDEQARRALELHPTRERWEQRCREWVHSQLAY